MTVGSADAPSVEAEGTGAGPVITATPADLADADDARQGHGRGTRKSNRGVAGFRREALKQWQKSCGLNAKQLAAKVTADPRFPGVHLSPGGLSHIMNDRRTPMMDTVTALAANLSDGPRGKCTVADLVDLEELAKVEPQMLVRLLAQQDPKLLTAALAEQRARRKTTPPRRRGKPAAAAVG